MNPGKKGKLLARLPAIWLILALALSPISGALARPADPAVPPAAPAALRAATEPLRRLMPVPSGVDGLAAAIVDPAQPGAPNACAATPAGFNSVIDRSPDFCVYYASASTTNAQATTAADHVRAYWDRYTSAPDFNFLAPAHTAGTPLLVLLTVDAGCNGSTSSGSNQMDAFTGCFGNAESIQKVLGHELFHRVQYSYDGAEARYFKEGTARAMEDLAFDNIDNWTGTLTAVSSSFNKQVNTYLAGTNADITSDDMRYNSALWWKYFTEKYGHITTEPQRGVDAFLALWQAAATLNDTAAIDAALSNLGAGVDFNGAFRRFAVANWTKDLNGVPDDSYNYIDEDQVGNGAPYGPLVPNTQNVNTTTPATWNNQAVTRYGLAYYAANVDAACKVVTAKFHKDSGADAFYHVIAQKGSTFAAQREGNATDWAQSFLNDGITKLVLIIGGQNNPAQVDLSVSCADPVVDIKLPNDGAVAHVGPSGAPGKFLAQVLVTASGVPNSPVIAGLANSDFKVRVNGVNALVTAGGFIQEQYWLLVQAPAQSANGTYDLAVDLEASGTSTVIGTDTNTASVHYDADNTDQVVIIDRSGSMGWPPTPRLPAAQSAAKLYIDIGRVGDRLAVVGYDHDVNPPVPFPMQTVSNAVRTAAKAFVDGLTATGATSIGDGLNAAVTERNKPTLSPRCSFVLLSDGMENSSLFWTDVQASVVGTGCPVTSIAFGPDSNETLMQTIATATGGLYFYNDVFVSAPPGLAALEGLSPEAASYAQMDMDLSNTYEYAQTDGQGRQRLLKRESTIKLGEVQTYTVNIDSSISEALFTLDWPSGTAARLMMTLFQPDGTPLPGNTAFEDLDDAHYLGARILNPQVGTWTIVVQHHPSSDASFTPYQLMVSGRTYRTLVPLLLDKLGRGFFTGNRLPIYALYSDNAGPITGAILQAIVTSPSGIQTLVPLFDDGKHDDGTAGDGLYGGVYTRSNEAIVSETPPEAEPGGQPTTPNDEGGYSVRIIDGGDMPREALGGFSLLEGPDNPPNGMPDTWEVENGVSDPAGDPDLDGLANLDEYNNGTDPNNSDSDGSGENDGSEVTVAALANAPTAATDPLNPDDDRIEAPEFFNTQAATGYVTLTFDVKPGYVNMVLYRAESPDGPWNLVAQDIPPTGTYLDTTVTNETTYYYKIFGTDNADFAAAHKTAILDGDAVKPSVDPVPPMALVIIDGGAPSTKNVGVTLTFGPYEDDALSAFTDITEMMLSNDPSFAGAVWQPFQQDVPWSLHLVAKGEVAYVYARFKDAHGNESVTPEVGSILFDASYLFLPFNQYTPNSP